MELLNLKPSRHSLEFSVAEWPVVLRRLQQFGAISREELATFDLLRVGREVFILTDETEDLGVISQSATGDQILKRVFYNLGAGFSASLLRHSFRNRRVVSPRMPSRAA